MNSLSEHLYRLAGEISKGPDKEEYHVAGVKIFFSAPDPKQPGSETLTVEKDVSEEANFQWIAYQILFTYKEDKELTYYIYNVGLSPEGKEKLPNKVFESDSNWSGKNKGNPSVDILVGDVKRALPKLLKEPNLFPSGVGMTIEYINIDKSDKGHSYSKEEFKKNFDNDFYVVLSPKGTLNNPFGKLIGKTYPKK
jgi:hypothetical protein